MWEKIVTLFNDLVDFLYRLVLTVFDFLRDTFFWCLEQLMTGAIALTNTFATGLRGLNPTQYIDQIPAETKGMMAAVGFNECIVIIVGALSIRMVIQLIPFIRWGS